MRRGERHVSLGPTEFRLLERLMEKPGRVLTRAQLLDAIWGEAAGIGGRTVDVHVARLRRKLSKRRERDPLRTVRSVGYVFDETFASARRIDPSARPLRVRLTPPIAVPARLQDLASTAARSQR